MQTNTFFICPDCGNVKKFRIFTSNYQAVNQSPEMEMRIDESNVMPSLRKDNNYVECPVRFKKLEYDTAVDIGKISSGKPTAFRKGTRQPLICCPWRDVLRCVSPKV